MMRNMDLIRELLLKLEALPLRPGETVTSLTGHNEEVAIKGYEPDEITHHLRMLREGELIECPGSQPANGGVTFRSLTWEGRDFLDSVRNPEVWKRTKAGASKMGTWTFGLIKDIATAYAKNVAKERLGLEL